MKASNIFRLVKIVSILLVLGTVVYADFSMVVKVATLAYLAFIIVLAEYVSEELANLAKSEGWV